MIWARAGALLADPGVYEPICELWRRRDAVRGTSALTDGRPTTAMATFVRLMVLKARTGWGYEVLVREVSDSLHLRRFCLIGLTGRVPDESTLRKLCWRLGAGTVDALTRGLIARSAAQTGFRARAARIDSTVVEADVKFPTDAGRTGKLHKRRKLTSFERASCSPSEVTSAAFTWAGEVSDGGAPGAFVAAPPTSCVVSLTPWCSPTSCTCSSATEVSASSFGCW